MNSFYTAQEIQNIGFKGVGDNVFISRNANFYSPQTISIGHDVRIDDFCILSGHIELGSYIHISAYSAIYGKYGITLKDYSGLSPRVTIFSAMDDFSGHFLINPMAGEHTNVTGGIVTIEKFVQVGAGTIIFPNVVIGEGSVIGALSLVNRSVSEWGVFAGVPVRKLKDRSKNLLDFL